MKQKARLLLIFVFQAACSTRATQTPNQLGLPSPTMTVPLSQKAESGETAALPSPDIAEETPRLTEVQTEENNADNASLEGRALENLVAFTRLLGYVRYFHPSDQAAQTDWNAFAVRGVQVVEGAESAEDLADRLRKLFLPLAPTLQIYLTDEPPPPVVLEETIPELLQKLTTVRWRHHGYGFTEGEPWIHEFFYSERVYETVFLSEIVSSEVPFVTEIGGGISISMPLMLYANDQGTFPQVSFSTINGGANETNVETFSAFDRATRFADVALAWTIFQHFYPYFDVVEVDWLAVLEEALTLAETNLDPCEFNNTLRHMIAYLDDGHARVSVYDENWNYCGIAPSHIYMPDFTWDWVKEQLVITFAERGTDLHPGDIVLKIDTKPVEEALAEQELLISGATAQSKRYIALRELLLGPKDSVIRLVIQTQDGDSRAVALSRFRPGNWEGYELTKIKEIEPGIMYVDLDRVTNEEFEAALPQLEQAKGIIFDLRGYPGDIYPSTIGHLTLESISSPQWYIPIIRYPDQENVTFDFSTWDIEPRSPYLNAKIVFITDERAISYAETYLSFIKFHGLGEIVGEPTAGTNCNAVHVFLPGGYRLQWTGCKVLNPDGTQFHGIGILPTVPASRTILGIVEGRDELLEYALEILKVP